MKKRVLMALVIALLVFAAVYASAASLNVSGGIIQAGSDGDLTCADTIQVTGWGLETDNGTVNSVKLNGAPAACNDVQLWAFIEMDGSPRFRVGPVTLNGTETTPYTLSFTPRPAEQIVGITVYMEGQDPIPAP